MSPTSRRRARANREFNPITGDMMHSDSSVLNIPDYLTTATTPFGQLRVAEATPLVELKSNYGISYLRDVTETSGSGTVTNDGSEYRLQLTANGADEAILMSAEGARYVPGLGLSGGVGVRIPVAALGNQDAQWGFISMESGAIDDGIYFGQDSTGLYVGLTRAGDEQIKVYQDDWNLDNLDGLNGTDNPSGLSLDAADGLIYQITFAWYGYGAIEWQVITVDDTGRPVVILVHSTRVTGKTSVFDPNLRIIVRAQNNTATDPWNVYVGGRQISVLGNYDPNRRITSQYRIGQTGINTTFQPAISFRRKLPDFRGVSVKLASLEIIASDDLIYRVRSGNTLTSASWQTPTGYTASETSVEADIAGTLNTGGEIIEQGLLSGTRGAAVASKRDLPTFDFIDDQIVTLELRTTTGTNITATSLFEVREEW